MSGPLVVIPTYNERENIVPLVEGLLSGVRDVEVLVVDDNSPDGTGERVQQLMRREGRVHLLHRPSRMGLGSAYVQGFKRALSMEGVDYLCTMDGDLSHDPAQVPTLIEAARQTDVAVGSRYLRGISVENWPFHRIALSYSANAYARLVTGLPVRDCTSGFCCYRREVIGSLDLDSIRSEGYAFLVEIKYKAWAQGFTFSEVPIVFRERRSGASKISRRIILEAAVMVWKLRLGL